MESEDQTTSSETKASDEQGASQVTRSYECSFCKRGFSNAQALGGHMNIHRKDKAKIKQSSSNSTHRHRHRHQPSLDVHSKVEDRTSSAYWPSSRNMEDSSSRDETCEELGIKQLPLFAETPSGEELGRVHDRRGIAEEMKRSPSDLDLELRLGPDPPSPTIGKGNARTIT